MDKSIERVIKQLQDIQDIVKGFQSETVQIRIVESLLPFVGLKGKQTTNAAGQNESVATPTKSSTKRIKRAGVKRVLDQIMLTDFFDKERTISEIVKRINDAGNNFKATEVSGILLAFTKDGRLIRYNSPVNNRFLYIRS